MPRVTLTDRMIAGLTSGGKVQRDLYDSVVPGLILRVTADGTRTWTMRYELDGRRRRATLGRYPGLSLAVARDKAALLMQRAEAGEDPMAPTGTAGTLLEVSREFRRLYLPVLADTTRREWGRVIEGTIEPKMGNIVLEKAVVARKALRAVLADTTSPHTRRRIYTITRRMIRWAGQNDLVRPGTGALIFADFARPEIGSGRRTRTLSVDETGRVLAAARSEPFLLRGFWRFIWLTGQRRSEVLSAEWKDIDLDEATWTLSVKSRRRQRTETGILGGRVHVLPLSTQAVALLRELRIVAGDSRWVFPGEGETGHLWGIGKTIDRVRSASGVGDFRLHDVRRTVASRLAELRVEQRVISLILAHTLRDTEAAGITAEVYVQFAFLPEMKDALQKWADRLDQMEKGR